MKTIWASMRAAWRFRDYRPQEVTFGRVLDWFDQFPKKQHGALRELLEHVQFIDERRMITEMRQLNERLLARLAAKGVSPANVVYVSFHEAGSSSAAVLNLVRDASRLENRGCHFIEASNVIKLLNTTTQLGKGAVIYVDDFVGTGNQFCDVRDFIAQNIAPTFSEFLLVHTICEEGITELARRHTVEPVAVHVHGRTERPLHEFGAILSDDLKEQLRERSFELNRSMGLGYRSLASMVVYYRNAPNTVPLLLRGKRGQRTFRGILPRTTDLDAA